MENADTVIHKKNWETSSRELHLSFAFCPNFLDSLLLWLGHGISPELNYTNDSMQLAN